MCRLWGDTAMATVTFFEGGDNIFRYTNLERYKIVSQSEDQIVLEWDEDEGAFNPDEAPFRVVMNLSDTTTYVPDSGPQAGETVFTGGAIENVLFFSETGEKQVSIRNIDPDKDIVQWFQMYENLDDADPFEFYEYLVSGDSRFISVSTTTGDSITTGSGDDLVRTSSLGGSYISDEGGTDRYIGGDGFDMVSYESWFWNPDGAVSGIYADLSQGYVDGPDGNRDTVENIDSVRGTFLDDVFIGDDNYNDFYGLAGDDLIIGGGGDDRAVYDRDFQQGGNDGIRADLRDGQVRDGFGNIDTLVSIEDIRGSNTDDIIIGNNQGNNLQGEAGDDLFRIYSGDDSLRGGDGADRFVFVGEGFGFDYVDDFDAGEGDMIRILSADSFADLEILEANGGEDTVIHVIGDDESEIYLNEVAAADVTADMFAFV